MVEHFEQSLPISINRPIEGTVVRIIRGIGPMLIIKGALV